MLSPSKWRHIEAALAVVFESMHHNLPQRYSVYLICTELVCVNHLQRFADMFLVYPLPQASILTSIHQPTISPSILRLAYHLFDVRTGPGAAATHRHRPRS
jgi:hypothetical protein